MLFGVSSHDDTTIQNHPYSIKAFLHEKMKIIQPTLDISNFSVSITHYPVPWSFSIHFP